MRYRAGDWTGTIDAERRSIELDRHPIGGDSRQWFLLAMAHHQLSACDEARNWYDKAVRWMEANGPNAEDLRSLRIEASQLLGIAAKHDAR
jgi:hypothetical protein